MRVVIVLLISVAAVLAGPARNAGQRIFGGEVTTIDEHPYMAAMLISAFAGLFLHSCGGTILNERTILSAAHCYKSDPPNMWRVRVGSTNRHTGGSVHDVARIINHPDYDIRTWDNDVSVLHLATAMVFNDVVSAAHIPGPNYILPDNDALWSIGWGQTSNVGLGSEQLKHVQMFVANQQECQETFSEGTITDNMLCISADAPGQSICVGDSGGPDIHRVIGEYNVVVGITSFTQVGCGTADEVPTVSMRVSRFSDWILANAFTG